MDGLVIIDSDPGGYAGSTAEEFVDLLGAHRQMLDRVRPGIELINWIHAGWEAYCEFYSTGEFRMGTQEEIEHQVRLLSQLDPEPWGLAISGRPTIVDDTGCADRVIHYAYGAIEWEPAFPRTTLRRDMAYEAGLTHAARGVMGNAQTHCAQLPNTFIFSRGALGLPLTDDALIQFAEDLIPAHGELVLRGWEALDGQDPGAADALAAQLDSAAEAEPETGPLRGMLFGSAPRFLRDLAAQLRMSAATCRALTVAPSSGHSRSDFRAALGALLDSWEAWQRRHGYRCRVSWPEVLEALSELGSPSIDRMLRRAAQFRGDGDTPYERLHSHLREAESETPRLIEAARHALGDV